MKKITIVSLASFLFLLLASGTAIITRYLFDEAESALFVGIAILIGSGITAIVIRERKIINVICFFINSIAMGILIRAWYIFRGFDNTFLTMMLVSLATVLYLWVFFALSKIPFIHKSKALYTVLCVLYVSISALAYVIAVTKTHTTYLSTFGYYMIIELAFIFAMSLEVNSPDELIRNLTLSTYSIFLAVIIAAVIALLVVAGGDGDCDCDCGPEGCDESCCECFDCCDCIDRDKVSKRRKQK